MVVGSDLLALAAEHLVTTDYALASRLALRVATSEDDVTFNRVWTRSHVAVMPMEEIEELINIVTNVIPNALSRIHHGGIQSDFWVTRLRLAMEALSRLALRLPPERAAHMFKQAMSYYQMEEIAKHPWLDEPVRHMLTRAWEALPKSHRANLILDILSAPIVGLDGFETVLHFYPEPGELLIDDNETPNAYASTRSRDTLV